MTPEEEKKFYLDSLLDLEDEYKAGEISEKDYREIKASYTKKASRAIKEIDKAERAKRGEVESEEGEDKDDEKDSGDGSTKNGGIRGIIRRPFGFRGRKSKNFRAVVALVLVFVLVGGAAAGIIVSLNSGQRDSNDEVSGNVRESSESILSTALTLLPQALQNRNPDQLEDVIIRFDAVLNESPANLEALRGKSIATYALGRTDEARTILTEALTIDPENIETLSRFAELEAAEGFYGEAQVYLDQIYALTPPPTPQQLRDLRVENTQNIVYLRRLVDDYGDGKLANHENPPQTFSDLQLPDADTALLIARAMVDTRLSESSREYAVAGLILVLLVEEEPENVFALLDHGRFFTNSEIYEAGSEESDLGFASLDKVLMLAPEELPEGVTTGITKVAVRRERALINLDIQRFDQALIEVRAGLEFTPDSEDLKTLEGRILAVAGRRTEAIEAFNQALELNTSSELPKLYRLAVYYCEERFEDSLADADSVITFTTGSIQTLNSQIQALRSQNLSTTNAQNVLTNTQGIQDLVEGWRGTIISTIETGMREAELSSEFSCPLESGENEENDEAVETEETEDTPEATAEEQTETTDTTN